MPTTENLDCPYVLSEIMEGDKSITVRNIIEQMIVNDDDDTIATMLDYFYQTYPQIDIEPIDKAIKQLVEASEGEWL